MRERIPFDAKQKSGTAPDGSIPIDIYGITGGGGGGADWGQIGGTLADQTDLKTALDGKATSAQGAKADSALQPAGLTKAAVGLGSVDNTSDAAKPVSTATQTALNLKAPLASPAFTGTPTGITKAHVGLGNVDNTSDANKPVSTAQATAIAAKVGSDGTVKNWVAVATVADLPPVGDATTFYIVTDILA